ncbi:MAG TPA: HD domain-containing protein [Actinomycetota bacterium]|nr:HD domain-containing protein [Actinomycetota bacterium]
MRLGPRFDEAFLYAIDAHRDQTRKGTGVPYASHLLGVASIVLEEAGGEDEAIAALLHDVVEDHGGERRLDDVRQRFGERIAHIVEACSDSLEEEETKPPWKIRKERYIRRVRTDHDDSALLVSVADKLYNTRAILRDLKFAEDHQDVWDRFSRDRDCVLWYYRSLVDAFRSRTGGRLLEELDATVTELEQLAGGPSAGCPDEGPER